ncbi:hypothetical protein E2562_019042 [Oryza meyeriana var. granulata]|uniref:Integrase catalytic domain-containing protein n=1 Tax=Oryza meyeriana var. granulata TaxID=110450 RepID=A0A6G1EMX3_9ORYZ|nr:hypothetical protein E2562_019042 [Oryza meyeriana var. granulata]
MDSSAASTTVSSPAILDAPSSTTASPATSGVVVVSPSLPLGSAAIPPSVFSPEQMTAAIVGLSHSMREVHETVRAFLQGQLTIPPPLPTQPPPLPSPPPSAAPSPPISYPYGMPSATLPSPSTSVPLPSAYVPLQQIRFPPSPSQIPAWALGSSAPIYSTTTPRASIPPAPTTGAVLTHGDWVRSCTTCQRNKTETLPPAGLLQPLEVPSQVWADISMDFIEGLPKVGGKSVILTVVDRFSKYAHFIALGHPYTATTVARAFFDGIVRLHGFPLSIVSDRDPVFTGHVWRDLFKMAGVKLQMH